MKRKGKKRLNMYIHEDMYRELEYLAKIRNITKTTWVSRAIYEKIKKEIKYQ